MCVFKKEGFAELESLFLKICLRYLITVTSPLMIFGLPFGIFL